MHIIYICLFNHHNPIVFSYGAKMASIVIHLF